MYRNPSKIERLNSTGITQSSFDLIGSSKLDLSILSLGRTCNLINFIKNFEEIKSNENSADKAFEIVYWIYKSNSKLFYDLIVNPYIIKDKELSSLYKAYSARRGSYARSVSYDDEDEDKLTPTSFNDYKQDISDNINYDSDNTDETECIVPIYFNDYRDNIIVDNSTDNMGISADNIKDYMDM